MRRVVTSILKVDILYVRFTVIDFNRLCSFIFSWKYPTKKNIIIKNLTRRVVSTKVTRKINILYPLRLSRVGYIFFNSIGSTLSRNVD